MVGVLKNPGLNASSRCIELVRFVENLEKDILHQIFRLARIPENPQGNFQNKAVKAIEQNQQGVRMTLPDLRDYFFVRQVLHMNRSKAVSCSCRLWDRLARHNSILLLMSDH